MYPNSFHPQKQHLNRSFKGEAKYFSRTERPPRYYFVDFGLSRKYDSTVSTRVLPIKGGDKSVPEFKHSDVTSNPFPIDVYYVGNMIKEEFLDVCGFFTRAR